MKNKIEPLELDYIKLYNRYEYLVEKHIAKICPKYINNEDFIQDAKLGLLEYVKNESFYNLGTRSKQTHRVIVYMHDLIERLYKKYSLYTKSLSLYDFENDLVSNIEYDGLSESVKTVLNILYNKEYLSDRECRIIRLYNFGNLSLSDISKIEGVTRQRIRQILKNSYQKLRHNPTCLKKLKDYI